MFDPVFMQAALDLSRQALTTPGTEPFGAVIVKNGAIVGRGFNRTRVNLDPTAHGEIEAIRDACRTFSCIELDGCELYTSCEPCALCVAAMEIVGIGHLYYAASLAQSEAILAGTAGVARRAVDVDLLRREAGATITERRIPAEQHQAEAAAEILRRWANA